MFTTQVPQPIRANKGPPHELLRRCSAEYGAEKCRTTSNNVVQCRTMSNNVVQCRTVFFPPDTHGIDLQMILILWTRQFKCRVCKDNLFQMSLTFLDVLNCREIQRVVEKCIWILRTGLGSYEFAVVCLLVCNTFSQKRLQGFLSFFARMGS